MCILAKEISASDSLSKLEGGSSIARFVFNLTECQAGVVKL